MRRNTRNMPVFRNISYKNRTAENEQLKSVGIILLAFLWRTHVESGFKLGVRRMQCDQKP
jgi:hypothetical protein